MLRSRKRIKSNSGKDTRDILYTNEPITIVFQNDDEFNDFIDYATWQISYFGYISIEDVLCYSNIPADFISAKVYGWGIEDLDRTSATITNTSDEILYALPVAKYCNDIYIPKYMG